jgi:hypothetical protein
MLASDLIGALAGGALSVPAVKDQYYRYARNWELQKAETKRLARFRRVVAAAWESKRSGYDGLDSFLVAAGTLGLVAAFVLKLFEL